MLGTSTGWKTVNCADVVNETTAIPQINNNLFILLNFMFNMFSGAMIIKKYGINSNNPAILYEMAGLLYGLGRLMANWTYQLLYLGDSPYLFSSTSESWHIQTKTMIIPIRLCNKLLLLRNHMSVSFWISLRYITISYMLSIITRQDMLMLWYIYQQ